MVCRMTGQVRLANSKVYAANISPVSLTLVNVCLSQDVPLCRS